MACTDEILQYLQTLLEPERFRDYCPNGLQVQGVDQVSKLVTGVTASQALLDQAVAEGADMILVHHGYFWPGEDPTLTGIKRQRLKTLLTHDINLVAYHLPLDAHPVYGNNAQLAELLDFGVERIISHNKEPGIIFIGYLSQPLSGEGLQRHIQHR